jgi:hypothetical protein
MMSDSLCLVWFSRRLNLLFFNYLTSVTSIVDRSPFESEYQDQVRLMLMPHARSLLAERATYWSSRAALILPQECESPSNDVSLNRTSATVQAETQAHVNGETSNRLSSPLQPSTTTNSGPPISQNVPRVPALSDEGFEPLAAASATPVSGGDDDDDDDDDDPNKKKNTLSAGASAFVPKGSAPILTAPPPASVDTKNGDKANSNNKRGGMRGGRSAPVPAVRKGKGYTAPSKSFFYQSVTGQYVYLHPFNVKCLLHQYGRVQAFPGTFSA